MVDDHHFQGVETLADKLGAVFLRSIAIWQILGPPM
jgi:hypothetical protein